MRPARVPAGTVEERAPPRPEDARCIGGLARTAAVFRKAAARLEGEAKAANAAAQVIEERDLPHALAAAGVTSFDLGRGWRVELEKFAHGSVKEADQQFAWDWVEADGSGDIVKATVVVSFGKGEHKAELKFLRDLAKRKRPLDFVVERTVHAATLKKFIKERVAAEDAGAIPPERRLPRDLFGIHAGTRAVLVGPEETKNAYSVKAKGE